MVFHGGGLAAGDYGVDFAVGVESADEAGFEVVGIGE